MLNNISKRTMDKLIILHFTGECWKYKTNPQEGNIKRLNHEKRMAVSVRGNRCSYMN